MVIRAPHIPRSLLLLGLLAGPIIGLVVHRLAVQVEQERTGEHLERRVGTAALAVEREIAADLEVLYTLRATYEAGPPSSPEGFARIARPLLARHPSLQALEWAPRVGAPGEGSRGGRSVGPGDGPTEGLRSRQMAMAGQRGWHCPVVFVEPVEGHERSLGFDVCAAPRLGETMFRAAATSEPTVTDPPTVDGGPPPARTVLAFLAVPGDGPGTERGPGWEPTGFFLAAIGVDRLLQQARFEGGSAIDGVRFELTDEETDGGPPLVSEPSPDGPNRLVRSQSASQPIEIGGQRWRLVARPTATYMKSLRTAQPLLLGGIVAFAWELLVGLVLLLDKQTRDRLQQRHARLVNDILASLHEGVIVTDTTGRILFVNRAATALSGQGAEGMPLSEWSRAYGLFVPGTEDLFPPEELPLARAVRGEWINGVEVFVRNPRVSEGTNVSVSGAPLLDGRGSVRGAVVVLRDVSERKRSEERLQRLSSAVEQTADTVLITDRDGTIEYVNPAFEETTGYSSGEALGRSPNILKSGVQSPEYYRDLWSTILGGEPFRGTTVNRKKSGQLYHAEQTITPMKDRDGRITHFVSVLKDVTERRRVQEQEIELQLASMVQRRLYPTVPPPLPGYDLSGAVFPARATCGDYFDFVPMPGDSLALVAADVSGHGLGAALVMAETRAYLRSLMRTTDDLATITGGVNRFLVADLNENFFVTMLLVRLEPGRGRLTWVNAAHPSGYVIDVSGKVAAELTSRCLPLGLFLDRWQCATEEVALGPGELLVLVTDGVLESAAPDGMEFGRERLLEVVTELRDRPSAEIVEQIHGAARDFARGQEQMDDATIVVCRRAGGPEGRGGPPAAV